MKYRVIDVLKCRCGNTKLKIRNPSTKEVPFDDRFTGIRCKSTCSFKGCSIEEGNVTPHDCMRCYGIEIVEGAIRCSCGQEYPIARGIPRYLENNLEASIKKTQKTFSWEWRMFRFTERNWGQALTERRNLFLKGIGVKTCELGGKLILDAGCGSGALSIEMAKTFGMEVVAMDLAFGIELAYEHNDSPYVHFIQASVLSPPFSEQSFDYLYSAGVLHHTNPDTYKAFKAIIPTLKRGGVCFVWLYNTIDEKYHPRDRKKLMLYDFIRQKVTSPLPIEVQFFMYLSFIPLFVLKQKISCLLGRKMNCLTWREKMQDFFDCFSPTFANKHTQEEVIRWFENQGFVNIIISINEHLGFGTRGELPELASE